jgi:hypothetical protein
VSAPFAIEISPFFWKGTAVTISAFILFVGSVYVLLSAVFGLRMGYLITAVSFFAWMIILSAIWVFGPDLLGTPPNLGPRGVEPHWQVIAAGTDEVGSQYEASKAYPEAPWKEPTEAQKAQVDTVESVVQQYLAAQAARELEDEGVGLCEGEELEQGTAPADCFAFDPSLFAVEDVKFAESDGTQLVGARGFYTDGGAEVTVFAYFDQGSVGVYSWSFLAVSVLGFLIHLPFLDRAERKRKEILTGGTAPPWYGPA